MPSKAHRIRRITTRTIIQSALHRLYMYMALYYTVIEGGCGALWFEDKGYNLVAVSGEVHEPDAVDRCCSRIVPSLTNTTTTTASSPILYR